MYAIYAYIDPKTTPTDRHIWQSHGMSGNWFLDDLRLVFRPHGGWKNPTHKDWLDPTGRQAPKRWDASNLLEDWTVRVVVLKAMGRPSPGNEWTCHL